MGKILSDEVLVDASDDVTVEASEEVTTQSASRVHPEPDSTPPPLSSLADSALGGSAAKPLPPSLLGVFSPSLPLPGVTAATSLPGRGIDDDVTLLAHGMNEDVTRPAISDDDEEETKVEPAATAIHAAASRNDVATALSEQASFEREKALRKAPSLYGARAGAGRRDGGGDDVEFADPEDDDALISADPISSSDPISADPISADPISSSDPISADPISSSDPISADPIDDDDGIEVGGSVSAHPTNDDGDDDATAMFAKSLDPSPLVAALTARRPGSPPIGSPFGRDTFGSARLPAPTPGFAGLSLANPAQAPAPASSPFGRLAPAPAGSPYGARATASGIPALQIPAPSGAVTTSDGAGLLRRVPVPIGLLPIGGLTLLVIGFFIGSISRGPSPAPLPAPAARPAMPAVAAPEVHPVGPPAPGATPTPIPAATAPAAPPAAVTTKSGASVPGAEEPGTEPAGTTGTGTAALGEPPAPPPRPVKHVVRRKPPAATADDLPVSKPAAKPAAAKPAGKAGKAGGKGGKVWVDPFAQ